MSDGFHDVLFPVALSFGTTGGPERRTEIVTLSSGREHRNARTARSRRRYDAGTGLRSIDDLYTVMAFFEARLGSLHAFRFRDPFDMRSVGPGQAITPYDQALGQGDGVRAAFQLVKAYGGGDDAYLRPIVKPQAGTVRVAVDGAECVEGTDFTLDATTGEIRFASGAIPAGGKAVTAGFAFDVPVRFDTDQLSANLASFRAGQMPSIPLVEVLL